MNEREVRMRAVEALSNMGIREAGRLVKDAEVLAEWIMAGSDDDAGEDAAADRPRRGRPPKTADAA